MERNEENEGQVKDISKFFSLNEQEPRAGFKRKDVFSRKIMDFECWQDIRKEMTFEGQDMALKFWRVNEGEIEMGISSSERQIHFLLLSPMQLLS